MDQWVGRTALVTGASSGIGASICRSLANAGMHVVGVARNLESIEKLSKEITVGSGSLTPLKCDLRKETEIDHVFDVINRDFKGVDVCINNAGMSYSSSLLDGTPQQWRDMLDVNVVAMCYCSKLAVKSMRERKIQNGLILNISSIVGHVSRTVPPIHFYSATKHAVKFLTEALRVELLQFNSNIRVTSISPGTVKTDFGNRMSGGDPKVVAETSKLHKMTPEDIANATLYILSQPVDVEINDIILRPKGQQL